MPLKLPSFHTLSQGHVPPASCRPQTSAIDRRSNGSLRYIAPISALCMHFGYPDFIAFGMECSAAPTASAPAPSQPSKLPHAQIISIRSSTLASIRSNRNSAKMGFVFFGQTCAPVLSVLVRRPYRGIEPGLHTLASTRQSDKVFASP
jgi:hypothetical protein